MLNAGMSNIGSVSRNGPSVENPVTSEALPDHLARQLRDLRVDPALEHVHISQQTTHLVTSQGKYIKWFFDSTKDVLSLKKYISPRAFIKLDPEGRQAPTMKLHCLVASGPLVACPMLVHIIEEDGQYRFCLWDPDIYELHKSTVSMLQIRREVASSSTGSTRAKRSRTIRRAVALTAADNSKVEKGAVEAKRAQRAALKNRKEGATKRTTKVRRTTIRGAALNQSSDQQSLMQIERSSNNSTGGVRIIKDTPGGDDLLQRSQRHSVSMPWENRIRKDNLREDVKKSPSQAAPPREPMPIDLVSDESDDESKAKARLEKELKCSRTMVRFFKKIKPGETQLVGKPMRLSEMTTLRKLMKVAAMLLVRRTKDIVLRVMVEGNEAIGIMRGEQAQWEKIMAAVAKHSCWRRKSTDVEEKEERPVCHVDVELLS